MKNDSREVDYDEYMQAKLLVEAVNAYGSAETLKAYDGLLLKAIPEQHLDVQRQLKNLRGQVVSLIKSGDLIPCGFEIPRSSDDKPIQISVDAMLSGEIDWEHSEVQLRDKLFSGVRLLNNDHSKVRANKFQRSGNLVNENKLEKLGLADLGPSQLLDEKAAAKYLGISYKTIQGLRVKGGGPTIKMVGKAVRYQMSELTKWKDINKG